MSEAATVRMRGWVLASFERAALPDAAIPFVLEELESGIEAYLLAAAARAVRGLPRPEPAFAPYLIGAIRNIQGHDDLVTFATYGAYARPGQGKTATGELVTTLTWLGSAAHAARSVLAALIKDAYALSRAERRALEDQLCALDVLNEPGDSDCCQLPWSASESSTAPGEDLLALAVQDHNGATARFAEVFIGRPSIVAFFYTRCDNPRKCSLTVTKIAQVQRLLAGAGLLDQIGTAAVTYDAGFDLSERLRAYGEARGWIEHPNHRLLRSMDGNNVLLGTSSLG